MSEQRLWQIRPTLRLSLPVIVAAFLLSLRAAAAPPPGSLTPKDIDEVVEHLLGALDGYVFPEVAKTIQDQLRAHRAEYRPLAEPKVLAERLTRDMRATASDKHLAVTFGEQLGVKKDPTPAERDKAHAYDAANGYGFRGVRRLAGNVGYVDLSYFSPDPNAGAVVAAAMQLISGTDALLIDLRRNGGGSGETATALLSYFFDEPVQLSSTVERHGDRTTERQKWTMPYVAGPRYLGRPVFVLIGPRTHSAAEQCAYDLKNLGRATLIGEPTSGDATSSTGELDLGHGFSAFIANGQLVSPVTHSSYARVGVQPDVTTSRGEELVSGYKAALTAAATKAGVPEDLVKERSEALADPAAALSIDVGRHAARSPTTVAP